MPVEPMRQDRLVGPGIKQQLKFFFIIFMTGGPAVIDLC